MNPKQQFSWYFYVIGVAIDQKWKSKWSILWIKHSYEIIVHHSLTELDMRCATLMLRFSFLVYLYEKIKPSPNVSSIFFSFLQNKKHSSCTVSISLASSTCLTYIFTLETFDQDILFVFRKKTCLRVKCYTFAAGSSTQDAPLLTWRK